MVKPGYKQTEVGVIPEDWSVTTIGLIADVKTGPFGSALHADDYVEDGTPIITVEHLGETGLTRQNLPMVSDQDKRRLSSYTMREGDIVFSRVGSVDRNAYVTAEEDGWLFSGRILRLRAKHESVSTKYLGYYFKAESAKERIRSVAVGQTMASLNTKIMDAFKVVLPPIQEQESIAKVLWDMEEIISALEAQLIKKKAIKQGAMQELLTGKKRLPGFSGEWATKTLNEISCEMVDGPFGSNLKKEHYTAERQVRIIQLSNIGETGWNDSNTKYTTFAHAAGLSRCIVQPGAVLIAKMMPAGRAIICPNKEKGYILGSDVVKVVPNDTVDSSYLVYATKSPFYLDQIADDTQGSTRTRTSVSKLRKTSILFPSKDEQVAIATVLSNMDSEIEALQQKLEKYRQLKQGMMQQLLTGKIRLV